MAPAASGFGLADAASAPADADANERTTNDTLARHDTRANAAQATLACEESGSNFTHSMTASFGRCMPIVGMAA